MNQNRLLKIIVCFILFSFLIVYLVLGRNSEVSGPTNNPIDLTEVHIGEGGELLVPIDQADRVWNFLYNEYVLSRDQITKLDPLLTSSVSEEDFIDVYFDTPDLKLLEQQDSLRYRSRSNQVSASDFETEQEVIQLEINDLSNNPLDEDEIRFPVVTNPDNTIIGGKKRSFLMGIIKKSQWGNFEEQFNKLNIDPYSLNEIFTINDFEKIIDISRADQPFITIFFDHAISYLGKDKVEFFKIEPELNEIIYSQADPALRQYLEKLNAAIINNIKQKFPEIKTDLTPKYNKAFAQFEAEIPLFRFLVAINSQNHPLTAYIMMGLAVVAVVIVIVIGSNLLLRNYLLEKRKIKKLKKRAMPKGV